MTKTDSTFLRWSPFNRPINWNLLNSYFYIFNIEDHDDILISRILHSNANFVPFSLFCLKQHWLSPGEICTFIDILLCCLNRL